MQKVADYNIATDGDTSLTPGSVKDVPLDVNATPDPTSRAILMFNLRIEDPDDTVLAIRVNKDDKQPPDFKYTFNSNVTRAMHEVIAAGVLKKGSNTIRFSSSSNGSGTAYFSDVVVFYQHAV